MLCILSFYFILDPKKEEQKEALTQDRPRHLGLAYGCISEASRPQHTPCACAAGQGRG
jgi:hypothetical protein